MPDFCTCGAQLPPDARFCHKCGKPQFEYPPAQEEEAKPEVVPMAALPALPPEISFSNGTAVRIGFLAALCAVLLVIIFPLPFPFVRLTLVFLAAGFLAVFLYIRRTGQRLTLRAGARLGWITGIFSFAIFTVQITAGALAASTQGGFADVLRKQLPADDAGTKQILELLQEPSALAMMVLLGLFFFFILLTLLSTLGGVLGAKVLARE